MAKIKGLQFRYKLFVFYFSLKTRRCLKIRLFILQEGKPAFCFMENVKDFIFCNMQELFLHTAYLMFLKAAKWVNKSEIFNQVLLCHYDSKLAIWPT